MIRILVFCVLFILLLGFNLTTSLTAQLREDELVFAFRAHNSQEAERMIVVGEVVSIEKAELLESKPSPDLNLDTRPDNVVVKVLNPKGIRVGQTLYLVEKDPNHQKYRNGNIVGQIKVRSIFDTTFFGKQLRGEGFTRLIEDRPVTVVRKLESADTKKALNFKKKGDSYLYRGDLGRAMKEYRRSIGLDAKLPDSHYALGSVYRKDNSMGLVSVLAEYSLAWKYRDNFSGRRIKFQFYRDYLEILKESIPVSQKTNQQKVKDLERMEDIIFETRREFSHRFEIDVLSAWTQWMIYELGGIQDSKKASRYERAKTEILRAGSIYRNQESTFYHETAILIFNEELGDWEKNKPKTDMITLYMDKIRDHGRRLLLINKPGQPISLKVIEILEKIE